MADAEDSKSSARKGVRVRLPLPAPIENKGLTDLEELAGENGQRGPWGILGAFRGREEPSSRYGALMRPATKCALS
jgi:hypothetical protein